MSDNTSPDKEEEGNDTSPDDTGENSGGRIKKAASDLGMRAMDATGSVFSGTGRIAGNISASGENVIKAAASATGDVAEAVAAVTGTVNQSLQNIKQRALISKEQRKARTHGKTETARAQADESAYKAAENRNRAEMKMIRSGQQTKEARAEADLQESGLAGNDAAMARAKELPGSRWNPLGRKKFKQKEDLIKTILAKRRKHLAAAAGGGRRKPSKKRRKSSKKTKKSSKKRRNYSKKKKKSSRRRR